MQTTLQEPLPLLPRIFRRLRELFRRWITWFGVKDKRLEPPEESPLHNQDDESMEQTTQVTTQPETYVITIKPGDGETPASPDSLRKKNWLVSDPAPVVRPGDRVTFQVRVDHDRHTNRTAWLTFMNEAKGPLPFAEGNPIFINGERTLRVTGAAAPRPNVDFEYSYTFFLVELDDLVDGSTPTILVRDFS